MRIRILAGVSLATSWRVASTPSTIGILMSIRITSGRPAVCQRDSFDPVRLARNLQIG